MNAIAYTLHDSGRWSALLDMIERKAPLLMRVGGGALSREEHANGVSCGRRLTDEDRAKICADYLANPHVHFSVLAEKHRVCQNTICRITRHLRQPAGNNKRARKIIA